MRGKRGDNKPLSSFVGGVKNILVFLWKKISLILQIEEKEIIGGSFVADTSTYYYDLYSETNTKGQKKRNSFFKGFSSLYIKASALISDVCGVITRRSEKKQLELEKTVAEQERQEQIIRENLEDKIEDIERKKQAIQRQIEIEAQAAKSQLDLQMQAIQKSTKTFFKRLAPIHNYLRTKSKIYYVWHLNPYSSSLHFGALLFFLATSVYFMQALYPAMYQRALADSLTCVWTGATSTEWDTTSNWSGCNSGIPTATDYLSFSGAPTNNLVMTSNKTVAKVEALTAGNFSKTFDTNYYDLTVNGNFTWQKGTLNFTGTSGVTVAGNFEISGTSTFNYNTSTIILNGATDTVLDSTKDLYNLTIDKTNSTNTVTLSQTTNNLAGTLALKKGTLNSNTLNITGQSGYAIGKDSNGGTATISFTSVNDQYIDASGGKANDNIEINNDDITYWNGSATVKNITVTKGYLKVYSGRLAIASADSGGTGISCAANANATKKIDIDGATHAQVIQLRSQNIGHPWTFGNNDCVSGGAQYSMVTWADVKDATTTYSSAQSATSSFDSTGNANWSFTSPMTYTIWNGGQAGHENEWGYAANWSNGLPTAAKHAVFSTGNINCNLTANLTGSAIRIISNDDYSGTLSTRNGSTDYNISMSGTLPTITWGGGTFNGNASTISLQALSVTGGTFIASSGVTTIDSHAYINPLSFTHGSGTIKFTQTTSISGAPELNNLEFSTTVTGSTYSLGYGAVISTVGTLTISGSYRVQINLGRINAGGNVVVTNIYNGTGPGSVIIAVNGTGDQTITGSGTLGAGRLPHVVINKSSGTLNLASVITSGGNWKYIAGSITNTGSSVAFAATKTITGSMAFNNLEFYGSSAATYTIPAGTILTVNGTFTISGSSNVTINTGEIYTKGNISITNTGTGGGGTGAITLNDTSTQTITGSSTAGQGKLPNVVVNKTLGKVAVTNTVTFDQNVTVTAGVLEFQGGSSGGYTYTMTTGKTMSVASGATARFAGTNGNNVILTAAGNWTLTKTGNVYANYVTVDHSQASATIYAMNSGYGGGSETNANWNYTTTAKTWDGGASTLVWNDANNWNPDGVPDGNDTVTLDVASTITTNADINFGTLTLGGTNATTLLLTNNLGTAEDMTIAANGTFEQKNKVNQKLSGALLVQSGGTMTHTANGNYSPADIETSVLYRLNLSVADSITVDSGGAISATGKGYKADQGPGANGSGKSASYGGRTSETGTAATYGSFTNPVSLGSGAVGIHSCSWGGGAVILAVAGNFSNNGAINSKSYITTPGECTGNQFGSQSGSGGSINISSNLLSGSGTISAAAAQSNTASQGGGGRISIYNVNQVQYAGQIGDYNGPLKSGHAATVALPANAIGGSNNFYIGTGSGSQNYIKTLVKGTDDDHADLYFNALYVLSDGNMTVDGNPFLNYNAGTSKYEGGAYKIYANSVVVDAGGSLNADKGGFKPGYGPYAAAAGYGGRHSGTNQPTYGSFIDPDELGNGGAGCSAGCGWSGGSLQLVVSGTVTANGSLTSNGYSTYSGGHNSGSGGSINVKADLINGSGIIKADAGVTEGDNSGGRISLDKRGTGPDLAINFSGEVSAKGYSVYSAGFPGTVYLGDNVRSNLKIGTTGMGPSDNYIKSVLTGTDDQSVDYVFGTLHILSNGELKIGANPTLNSGLGQSAKILADNLAIDSGGKIDSDYDINTYGLGSNASYYGHGGNSTTNLAYGSSDEPRSIGAGVVSGGSVVLEVTNTLSNLGLITANALTPASCTYAGGGGSVNIRAGTYSGNGTIQALGSPDACHNKIASGGRVAVRFGTGDYDTIMGLISVESIWSGVGATGTVFLKQNSDSYGRLIIKSSNSYATGLTTPIQAPVHYSKIIVKDKAKLELEADTSDPIDNTVQVDGDVTVTNNSSIVFSNEKDHDPASGRGVTLSATNISTDNTSSINSSGQGYPAQSGYSTDSTGKTDATCGGGGGYGGIGGAGSGGDCSGGVTYGANNQVAYIGSGGGLSTGGAGGGYYKLLATTITNAGTISSNGNAATANGGGGSGGGIILESPTITSTGTISANGGAGNGTGGGGGGGRVFAITNSTPTVTVTGGTGANNGASGTYMRQRMPSVTTATLPADIATNQSQNVAFTFSATDADSDYLRYRLELADDNGFATNLHTFVEGSDTGGQTVTDNALTVTFTGQNAESSTAYTSGSTATATIYSSTPLLQNHTYYWRASAIDPGGVDSYDGTPHYATASTVRSFTVAAIDKTTFSVGGAQTVAINTCSSVITFETRNSINEAVKLLSSASFDLTDGDGNTHFYSNSGCTVSTTTATIASGQSSSSFYYKSTHAVVTPFTITAAENPSAGWTDAVTTVKILPGILDDITMSAVSSPRTADQNFANDVVIAVYDSYDNPKYDFTGKIWFTSTTDAYAYPPDLPAKSTAKYTFLGEAESSPGSHTFLGSSFRLKQVGTHKIYLHNETYDGKADVNLASNDIVITPGEAFDFMLESYPASTPSWTKYAISGSTWDDGGIGAPYKPKVTVKDQFNNTKTDYTDRKVWFELYTSVSPDVQGSCSFTHDTEGNAYSYIVGDAGIKEFAPTDFSCETSGKNLFFRVRNETIHHDFLIYIKPLGLDHFGLTFNSTPNRDGTNYDQSVDNEISRDSVSLNATVTAYDIKGFVKTNYAYDATDADHREGEGYIYFWSSERYADNGSGSYYSNQELPYYRDSKDAIDVSHCYAFPLTAAGVHTFTADEELFQLYKGGKRKIYVSECITPTSAYAVARGLRDSHIADPANPWPGSEDVKYGVYPPAINNPDNLSVATHAPGSTHELDAHSDNSNNLFTVGPGDSKLLLSWRNPFDVPINSNARVHIWQCSIDCDNPTNFNEQIDFVIAVNGSGQWQSREVTGLTNDQEYWFKLQLGYIRTTSGEILSEFSVIRSCTPKRIAPVDVTAIQLDRDDPDHPGQVQVDYRLRFSSYVVQTEERNWGYEYFDPSDLSWNHISDSAVSGDKGYLEVSGNDSEDNPYGTENPKPFRAYIDLNTNFDNQYLATSFKIRVNVQVEGQGESNSESSNIRLDTKNPDSVSLIIDATNNTSANLTIAANDDSAPIKMMIATNANYDGSSWENYATSKNNLNITGADKVYIKFMDMYYNVTQINTEIRPVPANLQIKDASNIATSKYRLVLIWDDAANVDHYNIWRSTDNVNYSKVDVTSKNGYLDINLDSNILYAYKITSEDANHNVSLPAGPVSSQPGSAPDVTAEPQVTLYGWKQDQGVRAKISWNTDQLADSNVAYSKGSIKGGSDMTTENGESVQIAASPELTYNHEITLYNLDPSTVYTFKAFSKNEIQIAGYSVVLSFTTPERVPLLIQSMEISDVTITSAIARWSTSKLATTILEYSTSAISGDLTPAGAKELTDNNMNTDHNFKLENLESGAKYYLRVKTTDIDSNTTISDVYAFSTFAMPLISNLVVKEAGYNTATVEWSTNVVCDSNVEFGTSETLSGMQGKADSTTLHSVTLIGLESNTKYSYRVLSQDKFGNAIRSSLGTFSTTADTTAPKIQNIKAEVASTGSGTAIKYQAIISWDTDEPATSQIEFAMGIGGDYTDKTEEALSLNSSHVVILPELKTNSAYHFRIVSNDKVGNSAYSDDNSLITPRLGESLLQKVMQSLEETFSWVGRLRDKWSHKK